jgi:hypothetical protein
MKKCAFGNIHYSEHRLAREEHRIVVLRPPLAALLLLLLSFLLVAPSLLAQSSPLLLVPDTAAKGDSVEARIENAPDGVLINWTWDQGRLSLTTGSSESVIRFDAILDGTAWIEARIGAWRQRASIVITKDGVVKPPPPPGGDTTTGDPKIATSKLLLEQFRSGQITATQFFQNMGNEGISVKDLVSYKAHVIEQERLRLIKEGGYPATEAIRMSQVLWQREFAPYERELMYERQQGVDVAWERALSRYIELHPDLPYVGAKMDVGGWATEAKAAMRFEGDIDFSIIMADVEDAKQLREIFEQEIKKMFNLNMIDVDALGTAHRAATESVYIGDYGAKWAEIDAIRRGKMYKLKNVNGKVEKTLMTEDEKIVMLAVLENNEYRKKTGEDILDKILAEGGPEPKASMEPGVSLEFLRHVTVDAIKGQLSVLEKIVKISKYVNRSASDHGRFLEKVPNFTLESKDTALVKAVEAITAVKQDKGYTSEQKVKRTIQIATALLGDGWANDPNAALEQFGKRATELISHNIAEGIKAREKLISEGNKSKQERDAERKQLLDDLQNEFKVFEEVGVPFPEAARAKMVELQNYFKRTFVLSPEEMKKIDDIMKRAAENPNMLKLYAASVWEKLTKLYKTADEAIDGFNEMLDVLDNATVQKLRSLGDEISFMDGKVTLKLPFNIARINQELNESVLGRIGQSTAFKAFNLGQEGLSYYEAVAGGADWQESFTNLATEIFRRRVPAGGAVEAAMQGSYLYAGVQMVYMIFPPLAIPEGLYGMAMSMADWGVGTMNQWKYDAMVEALYTGATFQQDGAAWKMTGLSYNCPPLVQLTIDKDAKSREGLYKLLDSCAKVSSILYPQVKQHPALLQYEEMLGNSAVSSGKMSIMGMNSGWPYQYTGLSRYGEELYKIYLKKVDAVTLEYFKGVIDGLEKRKAWDTGTGYSQIVEIERELNCSQPLVQYTVGYLGGDAIKRDAERFQAIVDSYKRLKAADKGIADLADKWQTPFIKGLTPICTPASIEKTEKEAKDLLGKLEKAVANARTEVVALVGENPADEDLTPPTRARLCMAYNDNGSEEYRRCYEDHKGLLDTLKHKAVDLTVAVLAADEACAAQKLSLAVDYNKPCPECAITSFQILDESGAVEEDVKPAGAKTPWTPRSAGRKTVQVNVDRVMIKDVLVLQRKAQKPITIKPEADCPKLAVALDAGGVTEIGKDGQVPITARPVSLAPSRAPISRYFWKEDNVDKPASNEPSYLLSGKDKGGKTITVTVVARDAENNLSEPASITILVTDTATPAIPVAIKPVDLLSGPDGMFSIKDDATVTLKATPAPKTDSGRLRYQWSADGKLIDPDKVHTDSTIFKGEGWSGKTVSVTLLVIDEKNREGKGVINIKVLPAKGLSVAFEDHPQTATERDVLKIRVKEPPKTGGNYRYTWTRQGIKGLENTTFDFLDTEFQGLAGKTLTIRVDVRDDAGRTGFVETSITVTEPKPEGEKIKVDVKADVSKIEEDGATDITAFATPLADSGKLTYFWAESPQGAPTNVFRLDGKGHQDVWVSVSVLVKDEKGRTGEGSTSVYVAKKGSTKPPDDKKDGKPVTGDPKKQAEEKYRWLKESVAYLEALKEFDRKSYNSFEKSVTGSIVREFVSKYPPQYEKGFKLPDGSDKDLCGETFGDITGRLRGFDGECWSALNAGCKTIGTREMSRTVDGKEMKILESVTACEAPCGKAQTCSNVLKTNTGELGYANSLQDYVNERQLKCLGDAGGANGRHQRELDAKIKNLPESLPYKRFQEFAGLNDWQGYLAAVEKVKQEYTLPDPIPSPLVLPWTYSSPCGGGGSVADTSKLVVTLAAKPEKTSYKPGDIVNVTANVTGGKAPYAYTWTGDHAGEGQTVTRAATKPGSYTLSVEVKDGAGARGQTSITLKYEGVTAEIAGLTNQIIYGTSLTLRASAPGLGAEPTQQTKPAGDKVSPEEKAACDAWKACVAKTKTDPNIHCIAPPEYECWDETPVKPDETAATRIIWQSDKTLDFRPGTSYDGKTDVLFDRMGAIKIWAEIEKKIGDKVYEKVGETDQREVTVVPPKFKMVFNPEKGKGKVGQEVRVTIETDPKIKPEIINYEWNWPESSGRMEYEKNASVIGFVPKDPKPVKLLVAPKTVYDRAPIGGAILDEYIAGAYNVTVTGPRQMGPTPQIWKEGVGLVNAEQQIAVFQNVSMRAEVAPEPEKKPLRYQWTVTPGGCTVSNDISQEITVNCSQTGSFQAKVTVKDRDGADLGSASGSISITISQQTLTDSAKKAKETADKTNKTDEAKKKLDEAKADERKGKLDDAIKKADEAAALDPANKEATTLAAKWKAEKKRVEEQLAKTKQFIDESKFVDAQRELTVAKNLHGSYQPVLDTEKLLTEKWRGYDGSVRDRMYEVRSANEKKDFKKALELADKMRKEMKLYGSTEETLKQQEDWARKWEAEKDGKRKIFNGADEKLKNYDYAGAYKSFEEGFMNAQNLWSSTEPEYKEALKGREEAFVKNKRLNELTPHVQRAAEDMQWQMPVDVLQGALKTADEAIGLQPNNEQLKKWRSAIEARLAKTTADNTRLAEGRKYLDAGRSAENSYLSQESYVRADPNRWGENIEGQMQSFMEKAIENYTASLKYIPDPKVEQHIKELKTALDGRKKYLENVRLSKKLLVDAEALAKEAHHGDQSFDSSQQKFAKAIETYQQSLKLYRPSNAETIERIISNLDIERKTNAFKKYRADGTALEQQRPVEALAALEKAATFRTYAIPEGEWILFGGQLQNLRSRVQSAKDFRVRGEAQQQQGKIPDAIASYEQSVKLVPDKALEEHIKLLRTQTAKQDEKKVTADNLWQEGTALFNQGRPSDALTKFKESLAGWQDATRTKYVQDLEVRRGQAQALRDQGAQLQQQNRLQDAITRYNQSLQFWPDPKLKEYIASLEAKIKQDQEAEARKAQAKRLRDEGAGLQQQNRIRDAIDKYRESLTIWPDKQLEEHVRKLEASLAAATATSQQTTQSVTPPTASTGNWAGTWKSDPRPGKEDVLLILTQSGYRVAGTYNVEDMMPNATGGQQKVSMSGKLQGTNSGNKVNGVFRDSQDKENTATFEWTMASDGNSFTTVVRFDGKTENWTARRAGTAQTAVPPPEPPRSFDGAYSGSIRGVTSGTIQFGVYGNRVSGTINGIYQGDRFNGSWSGTVDRATGAIQATLTGDVAGYAFTGNLGGRIEETRASGTWNAKNQYGNPMGTWQATRGTGTSSAGTGTGSGSASQRGTSVTAEITNKSRQNAHVFVEGETFSPSNRLAPGECRKVSVAMPANGSITFKAGRDGQVMASKRWDGEPGNPSRVPVVIFDDTNPYDKLVVTTGLR